MMNFNLSSVGGALMKRFGCDDETKTPPKLIEPPPLIEESNPTEVTRKKPEIDAYSYWDETTLSKSGDKSPEAGIPPEWHYLTVPYSEAACSGVLGKVFERPIQDVVTPERQIPDIVLRCVIYLEKRALWTTGLFQPVSEEREKKIQSYRRLVDAGTDLDLSNEQDHQIVAGLLLEYLRELPEPVVGLLLCKKLLHFVTKIDDPQERLDRFHRVLKFLPVTNRNVMRYLLIFIRHLRTNAGYNGLGIRELTLIWGPILFLPMRIKERDLTGKYHYVEAILTTFLENLDLLFSNYSENESLRASVDVETRTKFPLEKIFEKTNMKPEKIVEYAKIFHENDLSEELMYDLSENHLRDLGISSMGDRLQIMKLIASARGCQPEKQETMTTTSGKILGIKSTIPGNIIIRKELGSGNFSTVYLGIWEGSTVACKKLQSFEADLFNSEANILTKLQHPNVIHYMGIWSASPSEHYMVMEYIHGGSLEKLVTDVPLNATQLFSIARQTAAGLTYLHSKRVLHRDLACRNLLVQADGDTYRVKVSDFGLSKTLYGREYYVSEDKHFARKWASPEACLYNRFSKASDVWSLGTTIWEMYSKGMVPWGPMTNKEAVQAMSDGEKLQIPAGCPQEVYDRIITPCWNLNPELRPELPDLMKIFQELDPECGVEPEVELEDSIDDESEDSQEYTY
eukprot:TRINITY_DN3018_c0_g1_i1.p1 TRINITY_DN3018_c0_g1~~TRINITY_DN3018_c0_g1_i1.p1  ORF type:complete len:683 (-),score=191.43 TRINITY_DN3018_c0_g1_i1:106-2154(-)